MMPAVLHPKVALTAIAIASMPAFLQAAQGAASPEYVLATRVLNWLLSGTIMLAAIKMILYFGEQRNAAKQSVKNQEKLDATIDAVGKKFERFADKVEKSFLEQAKAIVRLETTDGDHERRLGDVERRHRSRRAEDRDEAGG